MREKLIYENETPKTQSVEAVKALLAFVGRGSDPLPSEISLQDGCVVLVLSNKKDAYYCVTAKACSCPSAMYRPGKSCKHQRKYFPAQVIARTQEEESLISGPFKPIPPEDARPAKASSSLGMVIDAVFPVTTAAEVEYWQRKEQMVEVE